MGDSKMTTTKSTKANTRNQSRAPKTKSALPPIPEKTLAPDTGTKATTANRARTPTTKPTPPANAEKISALDAAARVLAERGEPMSCVQLIEAMASQGYWQSPAGKTPAATLASAMQREINV